jgi:hypothetical protein
MGKRKHAVFEEADLLVQPQGKSFRGFPNKAQVVEKPSIASSFQFGGERMIKAQRGVLERQSLEDGCLIGEGEELGSCKCTCSWH